MTTAFFRDERCFRHGGGNHALPLPMGGLVQPGGGLTGMARPGGPAAVARPPRITARVE